MESLIAGYAEEGSSTLVFAVAYFVRVKRDGLFVPHVLWHLYFLSELIEYLVEG